MPELALKCIDSWKKNCPDYEIREWNESNFDINCCDYVREAYESKKWAFITDVVRLYALVNYGGIYMDTDVEVLKTLDDLLQYSAVSGFETDTDIPTGLMACEAHHKLFEELLEEYKNIHFIREDGTLDLTTNVTRITKTCLKYGLKQNNTLQTIAGFTLLPCEYLCPKNHETKEMNITDNTIVIHHFDGSWLSEEQKYAFSLTNRMCRFLPKSVASYIAVFLASAQYKGISLATKEFFLWIIRKVKTRRG